MGMMSGGKASEFLIQMFGVIFPLAPERKF